MKDKLAHLKALVDQLGREAALLKLSKQYTRDEIAVLMDQLDGREVARNKYPSLAGREDITYPPSYYLEQTSSEVTARFKASLVQGDLLIDMTGGFGIDTYFFSQKMGRTIYIEQDPVIFEIASRNLAILNPSVKTSCTDAVNFLKSFEEKADWLYLDPIRRTKGRRFSRLEEFSPNIIEIQSLLFERGHNVMIKLSPMLDIHQLVKALDGKVRQVYVLAVDNECRELLLVADNGMHDDPVVESIHWTKGVEQRFVTRLHAGTPPVSLSDPLEYLYEPNAAIFKAHQYDEQAKQYSLLKLHPNTHLYTASEIKRGYEGKIYRIMAVSALDARDLARITSVTSFNIKTRNFPLSPEQVAKKLHVKEGGDAYMFCVKIKDGKLKALVCDYYMD